MITTILFAYSMAAFSPAGQAGDVASHQAVMAQAAGAPPGATGSPGATTAPSPSGTSGSTTSPSDSSGGMGPNSTSGGSDTSGAPGARRPDTSGTNDTG